MAWCIKKGLGQQRVGKQTSGQNIQGENRFENGAHWRLCEGHVALHHTPRFKTKASSAPVPGLLKYSNEIALIC